MIATILGDHLSDMQLILKSQKTADDVRILTRNMLE